MSLVWSCNEWDPLEEVIVGTARGARFPNADPSTQLAEYPDRSLSDIPQGPFPADLLEEAEEDLETFAGVLRQADVRAHGRGAPVRPALADLLQAMRQTAILQQGVHEESQGLVRRERRGATGEGGEAPREPARRPE